MMGSCEQPPTKNHGIRKEAARGISQLKILKSGIRSLLKEERVSDYWQYSFRVLMLVNTPLNSTELAFM